ncbi:hypothetical protein [Nostoc sp.]|uniref:hypothetical protein n=1 Tax=Nostoc sp. TaxID=1180 RepID=UPI002FFB715C
MIRGSITAGGLHQTVRRKTEGLRISVDFRFRRKFNEAYRAMVAPSIGSIEKDMSVPYKDWLKVGKKTLIVFDETCEEATKKQNSGAPVPLYTRGYRLVEMFNS